MKKNDYKNLKDLHYQVDKVDKTDESDLTGKTDEEEAIPDWVKLSKIKFDEIKSLINRNVKDGLSSKVNNKRITLKKK